MKGSLKDLYALLLLISAILVRGESLRVREAQACKPSGKVKGIKPHNPHCTTEEIAECCLVGKFYNTYKCSPPVTSHTKALLTLNSFEKGGDDNGPSKCDNQYHPDDTPIVAISTGWFNHKKRCFNNITISTNGRSITAMVVDECDSAGGCDNKHHYQPPCANNIVGASEAVWQALGVPLVQWGELDIVWSDT